MPSRTETAEKILGRFKGLQKQMQASEMPLFTVPAIWDGGQGRRSMPCDVVLTNQRLFGYVFTNFPRERLFLDALSLAKIKAVSLRHRSFEPLFRELLVSDGQRKVYIRAPRQKIESLYDALRMAIEQHAPSAQAALIEEEAVSTDRTSPAFGRQEIRARFERSPLAITLLFIGGLILEIGGAVVWMASHSEQTGLPLIIAGVVAVITAFLVRRQRG